MNRPLFLLLVSVCVCVAARGAEANPNTVYVNNLVGDDSFDGLSANPVEGTKKGPVRTIVKAFILVKPSGKVEIANTGCVYKEKCTMSRGGGTPENPTVIEGNDAVISGLGVMPPEKWNMVKEGVYETEFYPMSNSLKGNKEYDYWIGSPQIWWIDGKEGVNCKSYGEMEAKENGFFWDKWKKKATVHLPAGKKIADVTVEIPVHGTSILINTDYVVVKNLKSIFSWNDGFDTHNNSKNVVFKNCVAVGNCGQAFSNHDLCTSTYENCAGIGCASSGACDVNSSTVLYRNCVFANNTFEAGVYATEYAKITMENCLIVGNRPFEQIWQISNSSLSLFNCVIIGAKDNPRPILRMENGTVYMNQCTILDAQCLTELNEKNTGSLRIINSIIGRMEKPFLKIPSETRLPHITLDFNAYHGTPGVDFKGKLFNAENWLEYQKTCKLDVNSEWIEPLLTGKMNAQLPADSPLRKKGKFYGQPTRIGADLPACVWELYFNTKDLRPTPTGIE